MPDRLEISDALLPDAKAMRNAVLSARYLRSRNLLFLMLGDWRKLRTTATSHLGVNTLALWLRLAAPFITAETMGSVVMYLFPLAARMEPRAAPLVLRVAEDRPCD